MVWILFITWDFMVRYKGRLWRYGHYYKSFYRQRITDWGNRPDDGKLERVTKEAYDTRSRASCKQSNSYLVRGRKCSH